MNPIQDKYPHFEANQVLTNSQLNQIFDYLDEQGRLTRANLIGIGIECGLEIKLETSGNEKTIRIEKGCGISSAGYLLIEPDPVDLVAYQDYTLPLLVDYPPFKYSDNGVVKQYPLWELFPAGIKNTKPLGSTANFLADKTVILFLELKKEGLRNCSSNNCDDKGEEVTAIVRRLLIKESDLLKIIANANQLGSEFTFTDVEESMLSRINLPDIRVPRHILADTPSISSNQVLAAFHEVFHGEKLALNTANALSAAYLAFKPLVKEIYPTDPFEDFFIKFGALDRVPANTSQVRFLQYYCDFFDDIIQAYDEFRTKALGLMCACCPPEELFPRHLMLGSLQPQNKKTPGMYRHHFLPSAAISDCEDRAKEVLQLFQRLVEMTFSFTNNPTNPDFTNKEISRKLMPLRVTPSKLADVPLSEKAIPYYYLNTGNPPLYRLWNIAKTQSNRANQNQGFRSDEYIPKPPAFISHPLKYNLEPYNFLRIEGHLGKNFKSVMSTLISIKNDFRLPIEIIALRTGVFDASMKIDLTRETCRFEDLEALYDALRDELVCSLEKTLESLYSKKVESTVNIEVGAKAKMIRFSKKNATIQPSSFGAVLETYYANKRVVKTTPTVTSRSKAASYGRLQDAFINESAIIRATASFAEVLLDIKDFLKDKPLSEFDLAEFQDIYDQLEELNETIKAQQAGAKNEEWDELSNNMNAVHYANQLESFKSIAGEYRRRVVDVKKKQFFGDFLKKHPGVQHKSGVPLGGTFIVVYHDDPTPLKRSAVLTANPGAVKANITKAGFSAEVSETITNAFSRITSRNDLLVDPDVQLLINEFSRQLPIEELILSKGSRLKTAEKIINETVNEFADGTVIADFYLPYICCSDCTPIQYILPEPPYGFTVKIGCTNANGMAEVFIKPDSGTAPFTYQLDGETFEPLEKSIALKVGMHSIKLRDSNGADSQDQIVEILEPIQFGDAVFDDNTEKMGYTVSFQISGGKAPYTANSGNVEGNTFTSELTESGELVNVIITDAAGCKNEDSFEHTVVKPCNLPCDGQSRMSAFRLWLQPPSKGMEYEMYEYLDNFNFTFNGKNIKLPDTKNLFQFKADDLNKSFEEVMAKSVEMLDKVINQGLADALGKEGKNRMTLIYKPDQITEPFGIFWIEHFVCDTFNFSFSYRYARPNPEFNLSVAYLNEQDETGAFFSGMKLANSNTEKITFVPSFAGMERNLCTGSEYEKLCKGALPKMGFTMEFMARKKSWLFKSTTLDENIIGWIWDIYGTPSEEPFYIGEEVEAQPFSNSGVVQLTVITNQGCFGITEKKLLGQ